MAEAKGGGGGTGAAWTGGDVAGTRSTVEVCSTSTFDVTTAVTITSSVLVPRPSEITVSKGIEKLRRKIREIHSEESRAPRAII